MGEGEIPPGDLRGNRRHYARNETFIIWGCQDKIQGAFALLNGDLSTHILAVASFNMITLMARARLGR
ncbi:hypothetical protein Ancab_017238 [Ancistrocladus abbreviatus]